jgi:maleate isomerase
MEAELGKPVIPINAATYWHALRALGIEDRVPGHWLLERH